MTNQNRRGSSLDHRRAVRLVVNGEITARLLPVNLRLDVRDLGPGGFLAEAPLRLAIGSVHSVVLAGRDGREVRLQARCAHVRRRTDGAGNPRFSIGFAFVLANVRAIDGLLDQLTGSLAFF